jgi:hypothetical protein
MAITIPVTHAAKQKNSKRSPHSTGMFTHPSYHSAVLGHLNIPRNCLLPVPTHGL